MQKEKTTNIAKELQESTFIAPGKKKNICPSKSQFVVIKPHSQPLPGTGRQQAQHAGYRSKATVPDSFLQWRWSTVMAHRRSPRGLAE